jgi:hypothetical protein
MKKSDWQYFVDTLLFICMFGIAFIGILMGFFLAEGPTVRESEKYFLGLHRHQWGDIHLYLSVAFIILIIFHLMLAWSWIKGKSQALFKKRWGTIISLTVLVSALVVLLFWIFTPKYPLIYENYGRGARAKSQGQLSPEEFIYEHQEYVTITGNMTLAEVEKFTGIPAKTLAEKLGLPPKTSPEETLGLLRKRYGFSLLEARDAITTLLQRTPATPKEEIQKRPLYLEEKKEEHEEEPKITRGRLSEDPSGILITGRMTLYEIEKQTGISAREIASKLGLPHNVSVDESLGRLRRRYGFTMQDLRDVLASLMEKK